VKPPKKNDNEPMMLTGTEEGEILARLNDRVEKAIATIQELRRERDSLRTRLDDAEARLREHEAVTEKLTTLEEDYDRFRRERSEIRNRIESILGNLESLDAATSEDEEPASE
jgi:FtsZ-binding cell division protein ZapB